MAILSNLYMRFSPRKDAETSKSNELQEADCREYCAKHGYVVKAVYEDRDASGGDENRAGLWAAVNALKPGMVLVVQHHDRLARSVYIQEMIFREVAQARARIESVNGNNGDSPADTAVRQMFAIFSELQRKVAAERTSAAMRRMQAGGRSMSSKAPWGKRLGEVITVTDREGSQVKRHTLVDEPTEQQALEVIRDSSVGGLTDEQISRKLTESGLNCRGIRWSRTRVAYLRRAYLAQ